MLTEMLRWGALWEFQQRTENREPKRGEEYNNGNESRLEVINSSLEGGQTSEARGYNPMVCKKETVPKIYTKWKGRDLWLR